MYEDIILDHYRAPRNFKKLEHPTKMTEDSNPSCGDMISMEVAMSEDTITEIGFQGKGCVISIAATSLLTEYANGKSKNDLMKLTSAFMIELLGIDFGPTRLKCALLPLQTLQKLLNS